MNLSQSALGEKTPIQRNLPRIFIILCLLFGLIFILIEPPFAVADENVHFANICRIARGGFLPDVEDGYLGSYISQDEYHFLNAYFVLNPVEGIPNIKGFFHSGLTYFEPAEEVSLFFYEHTASGINPLPYLPSVTVIVLFRLLGADMNPYNIMMTSKLVSLFCYVAITYFALKKTKLLQKTMFFLALMPMSVFQAASMSYDALLIPCAFLLFAYLSKFWLRDAETKVGISDIIILTFTVTMIICCKIAYAPYLLVLFTIPFSSFRSRKQYLISIGCVVGALFVTYGIPQLIQAITVNPYLTHTVSEAQVAQKAYLFGHIYKFPLIILNTFKEQGYLFLESYVGKLGWLDILFPKPFIFLFWAVLIFTAVSEVGDIKGIRHSTRLLSLASFLAFLIGSFYVMYTVWTPGSMEQVGGMVANGCQGRYFIPCTLLLMIVFASPLVRKIKWADRMQAICADALPYCSVAGLSLSLILMFLKYFV